MIREMRAPRWARRSREADRAARDIVRLLESAEALLAVGRRRKEIISVLKRLPTNLEPSFHLRAADCFQALGQLEDAESHYRSALALDVDSADALHGLGLIHQERGETDEMIEAWLRVRAMDLALSPFPWSLSLDEFTATAESALAEIPESTRKRLANLPVLAAEYPSEVLIRDGVDPRILGIITGVPFPFKLTLAEGAELDCVQLFQRNIERICSNRDEVLEEIRITVLHETGHYFGLSDEDLEEIGLG